MKLAEKVIILVENKYTKLKKYNSDAVSTIEKEIKRSSNDDYKSKLSLAMDLLIEMESKVSKGLSSGIKQFRKKYLAKTGGRFDTIIREAIADLYDSIAAEHDMEDIARDNWE